MPSASPSRPSWPSRLASLGALAAALATCTSCSHAPAPGPAPAPSSAVVAAPAGWEGGPWGRFHSKRFGLRVELPSGADWKIDDHRTPWLVATHPPTESTLRLRVLFEDDPVNHERCERRARDLDAALPVFDAHRTVEVRETEVVPGWDTRAYVGTLPVEGGVAVEGRFVAFAAKVRKCLLIDFRTRATGGAAGGVVGARLGDVSDRLVHGLRFDDELGAPAREPLPVPR